MITKHINNPPVLLLRLRARHYGCTRAKRHVGLVLDCCGSVGAAAAAAAATPVVTPNICDPEQPALAERKEPPLADRASKDPQLER